MKADVSTVYIVDDDAAVRGALLMLLKSVGLRGSGYASAQEFLSNYHEHQPGCLVLDVRMPGLSGLELQQQLNLRGAMLPVLFMTGHADVPMAVEAMQAGAFDFLQKPFRDQDLLDRIQRALQHDNQLRGEQQQAQQLQERYATLTPREVQVMKLMTDGRPNKLMAVDLDLSQRTIEIHRAHVMEKMQARSLAQLVRMSLQLA
jgi:FixJ family two-component response regulator